MKVVKEQGDNVFRVLQGKKVKVKYVDSGEIRSLPGIIKDVNGFYIVLERPKGDQVFINHNVINRIVPIEEFEEPWNDGHKEKKNEGEG